MPARRLRPFLLVAVLGAGCATGRGQPPQQDGAVPDSASVDRGLRDVQHDWQTWPDRRSADRRIGDRLLADLRPLDIARPVDRARPVDKTLTDRQPGTDGGTHQCPDPYEPDESCAAAASAGSVVEATEWATIAGTLDPASDVDWYTATGLEATHLCWPPAAQCYKFWVRVEVPAGRVFQVCLQSGACTATKQCVDNLSQPGPKALDISYSVDGICGVDDNTQAFIMVKPLDGKGGCAPYTLSFRYDGC